MSVIQKIKNTAVMKPVKKVYKKLNGTEKFAKPLYFLDNSKEYDTACFILAGYKSFTWDIVFKRIKKFCPDNIDVCIVSSGLYNEKLKSIAESNGWSYIALKRNCVTQALNTAISKFSHAESIFKIDEDIFITEGFFDTLPKALTEAKKDYFPCFAGPLIPINGFGYRKILDSFSLTDKYAQMFEYPIVSAGSHMKIENDLKVARFFWGEGGYVPQIDMLNRKIKETSIHKNGGGYLLCPIRFSIGAIFFERRLLEEAGYFPVHKGSCMGLDEEFLCNRATSFSKAIIVSDSQVVGHLSFGTQNKGMEEYFKSHTETFEIQ